MEELTLDLIKEARERISEHIIPTELMRSSNLSEISKCELYLKLESQQRCKVFKFRGAVNAIRDLPKGTDVCISSAGSHSQSVALACRIYGHNAHIFMPLETNQAKIDATVNYGGDITIAGHTIAECAQLLTAQVEKEHWHRIHPYTDPIYVAGEGTVALEILEQCPDVETVVVPIGGGALIASMAVAIKALKPDVRIIGVCFSSNTYVYNHFCDNMQLPHGEPDTLTPLSGCMEEKIVGEPLMKIINELVDEIVVVNEDQVSLAVAYLAERGKIISEGAGAAGFAAIRHKKFRFREDEKIVSVVSGANIQMSMLARSIERMLFLTNLRIIFHAILPYGTRYLAEMLNDFVELNVHVVSCQTIPQVDIAANKETYVVVAEVSNDQSIMKIRRRFSEKDWGFKLTKSGTFEGPRISMAQLPKIMLD